MKRNRLVLMLVSMLAAMLMGACNDPTCDPQCGCATDGTATTWAYCMATKK